MSDDQQTLEGPDLTLGVPVAGLADDAMLLGRVADEPVLLVRRGGEIFAIGATCTHYNGPLAEGLLVDDTVRCPLHHACFSLRTGEALRAPALNPLVCWRVEQRNGIAYVREKIDSPPARRVLDLPSAIVIVGGGAAGNAAAETLRNEGYAGSITMLSADDDPPCDRPNLSKDYLAGTAPEEWIPLRPPEFYREHAIDLRLGMPAVAIDAEKREIVLHDGIRVPFDALLLATGAAPRRLDVPGADGPQVHYLRTLADARAVIAAARTARRAVVIGDSFIGLEVAASLRTRGIDVHVVAPHDIPMARIMGPDIGRGIKMLHERHGVVFHLRTEAAVLDERGVTLKSGEMLAADLIVVGIGVHPSTALAEQAGLAIDRGVQVDDYLETSKPGIFAAGDIARWPDRRTGNRIRVEHWVVAERQGQTAARNMLGAREKFGAVPFFWSQHYDIAISYVGHAENWDRIEIDGSPESGDCKAIFLLAERIQAVVTIGRDRDSLRAERAMETVD